MSRAFLTMLNVAAAAQWSCPATFSNGPCFTLAKNWTEAQRTCEAHGSNLVTITSPTANADLGSGGCFSAAPWNSWQCSWIGATDLREEGSFEWANGAPFSYHNWGEHEPDTGTNNQNCAALCHGGSVAGYSGDFWIDLDCSDEYAFCCDQATFSLDAGTAPEDSFLNNLTVALAPAPPPDPDPYEDRRLCFSTRLTWEDAQALCRDVDSNLLTIDTAEELEYLGRTVHFSPVPESWGIDWKCFWTGLHDRGTEGNYEWISNARPSFTPPFGPFEAGNGQGEADDCVALCQSACANASAPDCNDFSGLGYVGNFIIDVACTDEYSFCCDGLAATYVERGGGAPTSDPKDTIIIILAVVAAIAALGALVALCKLASRPAAAAKGSAAMGMSDVSMSVSYNPPLTAGA
jgi:hypothetical protein